MSSQVISRNQANAEFLSSLTSHHQRNSNKNFSGTKSNSDNPEKILLLCVCCLLARTLGSWSYVLGFANHARDIQQSLPQDVCHIRLPDFKIRFSYSDLFHPRECKVITANLRYSTTIVHAETRDGGAEVGNGQGKMGNDNRNGNENEHGKLRIEHGKCSARTTDNSVEEGVCSALR